MTLDTSSVECHTTPSQWMSMRTAIASRSNTFSCFARLSSSVASSSLSIYHAKEGISLATVFALCVKVVHARLIANFVFPRHPLSLCLSKTCLPKPRTPCQNAKEQMCSWMALRNSFLTGVANVGTNLDIRFLPNLKLNASQLNQGAVISYLWHCSFGVGRCIVYTLRKTPMGRAATGDLPK